MPKLLLNPYRNNLTLDGLVLKHDAWLNQPVHSTSDVTFSSITVGEIHATGNVLFTGRVSEVETEHLLIKDNIIDINVGNDNPLLNGGFRINRGPNRTPFDLLYSEVARSFKIGYADSSLQAVATRQDEPVNGWLAVWNADAARFDSRDIIDVPVSFDDFITCRKGLKFPSVGSTSSITNVDGSLIFDSTGVISFGTSPGVVAMGNKRMTFGNGSKSIYSDPVTGRLVFDTSTVTLSPSTKLTWGEGGLSGVSSSTDGNDLTLDGKIVTVKAGVAVDFATAVPIFHAGVGEFTVSNGSYRISSTGSLSLASGSSSQVIIPGTLALAPPSGAVGSATKLTVDITGNMTMESTVGQVFLNPARDIVINAGKFLCFARPGVADSATRNSIYCSAQDMFVTSPGTVMVEAPLKVRSLDVGNTALTIVSSGDVNAFVSSVGDITMSPNVAVTLPIGKVLRFASAEEISSNGSVMTISATSRIAMSSPQGVRLPVSVPLTFGDDQHYIYQDTNGQTVVASTLRTIFSSAEKVVITSGRLQLGNVEMFEDVDGALTLMSGTVVKSATSFTSAATTEAVAPSDNVGAQGSIIAQGGLYVAKNLVADGPVVFQSRVNVGGVVDMNKGTVPLAICNASPAEGRGISLTASWDTLTGYSIGRGWSSAHSGRAMMFTVPTHQSYGPEGSKPSFVFANVNEEVYVQISDGGMYLAKGRLTVTDGSQEAFVVSGGVKAKDVTVLGDLSAGAGTLRVTPEAGVAVDNPVRISGLLEVCDSNKVALFRVDETDGIESKVPVTMPSLFVSGPAVFTGSFSVRGALTTDGDLDLKSHRIINHASPELPADLATKEYVDAFAKGTSNKRAVAVATTEALDLSQGINTVDGQSIYVGSRVLLKDQVNAIENGIYLSGANGILQRADDMADGSEAAGNTVFVTSGETNKTTGYAVVARSSGASVSLVVGVDAMEWTPFSGASMINAGAGIARVGNTFSAKVDGASLIVAGNNEIQVSPALFSTVGLVGGTTLRPLETSNDQSHVSRVGTLTAGVWHGSPVDVSYGGTGRTSLPVGKFLVGNGSNAVGVNDSLVYDPSSGYLGVGTQTPHVDVHVVNRDTATSGAWIKIQDTAPIVNQSSGLRIQGNIHSAQIALTSGGSLDLTTSSTITLSTQSVSRVNIDTEGRVSIGTQGMPASGTSPLLTVYGRLMTYGSMEVRGNLTLTGISVQGEVNSAGSRTATFSTDVLSLATSMVDCAGNLKVGNLTIESSDVNEVSLLSKDRVTGTPLPLKIKTGPDSVAAVAYGDRLVLPGVLQVGGNSGDINSGFSFRHINNALVISPPRYPNMPPTAVRINAPVTLSEALRLFDPATPSNWFSMRVVGTTMSVKSATDSGGSATRNINIGGGGATDVVTTLSSSDGKTYVKFEPSVSIEGHVTGLFTLSENTIADLRSDVRIGATLQFGESHGIEGVMANVGWYYMGVLGVGHTSIKASVSWEVSISYDGLSSYTAQVVKHGGDERCSLYIYLTENSEYHLFTRVFSGPIRLSVVESPTTLSLTQYEGVGNNPAGTFSNFSGTAWHLSFELFAAQGNGVVECATLRNLSSAVLNNVTLHGTTNVVGDFTQSGQNVDFTSQKFQLRDLVTNDIVATVSRNAAGGGNVRILSNAAGAPAFELERTTANRTSVAKFALRPTESEAHAGAAELCHTSDNNTSRLVLSTRNTPRMVVDDLGRVDFLSTETFSPALMVRGAATFAKSVEVGSLRTAKIVLQNEDGKTCQLSLNVNGDVDVGGLRITNAKDPERPSDLVTWGTVQGLIQGLDPKESVVAASTEVVDLNFPLTVVDGVVVHTGDRVLLKNQSDPTQNGIYTVNPGGSIQLATDFAPGSRVSASYVFVSQGSANNCTGWVVTNTKEEDLVGIHGVHFTQFSGAGQILAGPGVVKDGNVIKAKTDGLSLEIVDNAIRVKSSLAGTGLTGGGASALSVSSITHLTAVGNISSGQWKATPVATQFGGTGSSGFSPGRVPFSDGAVLTQGNFVFDGINNRLGINTLTPTAGLTVVDRDIHLTQSPLTGAPAVMLSSTGSDHSFALRNENRKFLLSSGQGQSRHALRDVVTIDSDKNHAVTFSGPVETPSVTIGGGIKFGQVGANSASVISAMPGAFTFDLSSAERSTCNLRVHVSETDHLQVGGNNDEPSFVIQGQGSRNLRISTGGLSDQLVLEPSGHVTVNSRVSIGSGLTVSGGVSAGDIVAANLRVTGLGESSLVTSGGVTAKQVTLSGGGSPAYRTSIEGRTPTQRVRAVSPNTSALLELCPADGDGSVDVQLRVIGKNPDQDQMEYLTAGYESASRTYCVRSVGASLTLSAGAGKKHIMLSPEGITTIQTALNVLNGTYFASTSEATNSTNGAVVIEGGMGVKKSLHVGVGVSTPGLTLSAFLEFANAGSTAKVRLVRGEVSLYDNPTGALSVHLGDSRGPGSSDEEKVRIGLLADNNNTHVVESVTSGTVVPKNLLLRSGNAKILLKPGITPGLELSGVVTVTSAGSSALTVRGGVVLEKSLNALGVVTLGKPGVMAEQTVIRVEGSTPWVLTTGMTGQKTSLSLSPQPVDSTVSAVFAVTDKSGGSLLEIDTMVGKIRTTTSNEQTITSTRAQVLKNGSGGDMFVFDTVNHTMAMCGGRMINMADPILPSDATTKRYVDTLRKGLGFKEAADVASTENVDLLSAQTVIDDVMLAPGFRVLLANQHNLVENGIYVVNQYGYLSRAEDFAHGSKVAGSFAFVQQGTLKGDKGYVCIADTGSDVVGVNALRFSQFNGNIISAGTGLFKDGNNVLNIALDPLGGLSTNANKIGINPEALSSDFLMTDGVISLKPFGKAGTIYEGRWQASTVDIPFGGTGTNVLPREGIVYSKGAILESNETTLAWDYIGKTLFVNSGPVDRPGRSDNSNQDGIVLFDKDLSLFGADNALTFADSEGLYNWSTRRHTEKDLTSIGGPGVAGWSWIRASKSGQVVVVMSSGPPVKLYVSRTFGANWVDVTLTGENDGPRVWWEPSLSYDGRVILLLASESFLYVSRDAGETFTPALTDLKRIWNYSSMSDSGQYMLATSYADGMFASADYGVTWRMIGNLPTDVIDLGFVHVCKDGLTQFAGYFGGPLFVSKDSGATFNEDVEMRDGYWYDISEAQESNVLALYDYPGHILVSTDGGTSWSERMTDAPRKWVTLQMSSDGSHMVAAAENDNVYLSRDTGTTWNVVLSLGQGLRWTFANIVVSKTNPTTSSPIIIAGGKDMPVYITEDGGTTHRTVGAAQMSVAYSTPTDQSTVYFAPSDDYVQRFTFVPHSDLIVSCGLNSARSGLSDFLVLRDWKQFGVGFDAASSGDISHTLEVNGTLCVHESVSLKMPLNVNSGGTGVNNPSRGVMLSQGGTKPMTSSGPLPAGFMLVGSPSNNGSVVVSGGADLRALLGLQIGQDVPAWGVNLDNINSLQPATNSFLMGDGSRFLAASSVAAASALGLGQLAYLDGVGDGSWSGEKLSVTNGGTGSIIYDSNSMLYFDGERITGTSLTYNKTNDKVLVSGRGGLSFNGGNVEIVQSAENAEPSYVLTAMNASSLWQMMLQGDPAGLSQFVLLGGTTTQPRTMLTVRSSGDMVIHSTSESSDHTNGGLQIIGGLGVKKAVNVGGTMTCMSAVVSGALNVQSSAHFYEDVTVAENLTIGATWLLRENEVDGALTIENNDPTKFVRVKNTLHTGGLFVDGETALDGDVTLSAGRRVVLSSTSGTASFAASSDGNITVSGSTVFEDDLKVSGKLVAQGDVTISGKLFLPSLGEVLPTLTVAGASFVNLYPVIIETAFLSRMNTLRVLNATFKATPTYAQSVSIFTVELPERLTAFTDRLQVTAHVSAFVDANLDADLLIPEQLVCTGRINTRSVVVKFNSASTAVHNVQLTVTYLAE